MILPSAGSPEALDVADRYRRQFEQETWPGIDSLSVTASFGVSTLGGGARGPEELIDQADQALYASKHGGRNRVTVYASPDASLPMTKDEAHAA